MWNFHFKAVKRYFGQAAFVLLAAVCYAVFSVSSHGATQAEYLAGEFWKEANRSDQSEDVSGAEASLCQVHGSNFLHECRARKGRDSLNYGVIRRSADKEPHDNNLETPFLTMAGRKTATATYHEWQVDALAAAAVNQMIEGDDATGGTSTPTSRLGNYCQISSKYAVVTDTMNAVDKAGRGSEMAYQVAKRLGELKRNQRCALMA